MTSIAAYGSLTGVYPEQEIDFMVSYDHGDASPDFTIDFYREGVDEAHIGDQVNGQAEPQLVPENFNVNGCQWSVAYQLVVPADWISGVYIARFTGSSGDTTDVLFVVKAAGPGRNSKIVMAVTVNTAQAYNDWGGTSLYTDPRSPAVSFDRPGGVVDLFRRDEQQFIAWLESNGFAAEYCTSIDLHENSSCLDNYRLLLSVGHDEYWSKDMRDNVEAFVANGGNVAFFSGNVCWWQVRFENNNRTMVCYKTQDDPVPDRSLVTVNWPDAPVLRPGNSMVGVGWRTPLTSAADQGAGWWDPPVIPERRLRGYTATYSSHWVFDGTGLADGDEFGVSRDPALTVDGNIARTVIGYETDSTMITPGSNPPIVTGQDGTPRNFVVLARADLRDWPGSEPPPPPLSDDEWKQIGQSGSATMGLYQRNGTVFTAGTANWAGGLSIGGGWTVVDQITQNLLRRLSCHCPPAPEIANAGFEDWTKGMPVGWVLEGAGFVTFEEADPDPAYWNQKIDAGGRFSLRVDGTAGETWISQVGLSCAAKTFYGAGCWAKAYAPGATLRLQLVGGNWTDFAIAEHSGSGEWEYIYAAGALPDDISLFRARVKMQVAGGQIAWFDNVSVTELPGHPAWSNRRPAADAPGGITGQK
jgi:hypothetical protein